MLRLPAALLAVLLLPPLAGADTVRLVDGRVLRGEITAQNEKGIELRTKVGITVSIASDQIKAIEPDDATDLPKPSAPAEKPATPTTSPAPATAKHSATCPGNCPACEALFAESLSFLCDAVDCQPPQAPVPLRLGGWRSLQAPAASVLGVVLLGEGNTCRRGPHRQTLAKLSRYVTGGADQVGPDIKSHASWPLGFSLVFLSELHRVEPSDLLKKRIDTLARTLQTGSQGQAGWCHSLEKTGYGPFVGVTIWAAAGLAAAKEQGVAVDDKILRAAYAGLLQSIGPRAGGSFYYVSGRTDVSVGRTGGVTWVLGRYAGDANHEAVKRGVAFIGRHADCAQHGHASPLMNFTQTALAAGTFGGQVQTALWAAQRKTLLDARRKHGGFAVQDWKDWGFRDHDDTKPPSESPGTTTTWPDPMYGNGWASCWMLLAWQAGRGKCLLTRRPEPTTAPAPHSKGH